MLIIFLSIIGDKLINLNMLNIFIHVAPMIIALEEDTTTEI